jgi:hypothetical protein
MLMLVAVAAVATVNSATCLLLDEKHAKLAFQEAWVYIDDPENVLQSTNM